MGESVGGNRRDGANRANATGVRGEVGREEESLKERNRLEGKREKEEEKKKKKRREGVVSPPYGIERRSEKES